jgi:hypothetical protein
MKKKLFAILFSIVMVAGLLPATALAAEPTVYDIWVDGVQVTSENKDNLCSGTVSYDPTTHTLSLNNATLDSDTMSDYGIKTTIPSTLKIRLTGTNSITRTDPGGGVGIYLNYSNSVEITGDGTLVINVIGENYDGISTGADVKISDKARVIINSEGGLGIAGRMVEIDGATVDSTGLYAGIDAHWMKIINGADVTLKATQDGRNGAYIWKDQEGNGGDIELAASKVKATSYYPGLYAAGDLTVNGGEVNCTSTTDGAIWAKGNILIKGGAKVTTDGKFPMGGNGTFTVEEAEIDAKNTNENNIPAIFDECVPVIADGYHLNYAKAVDSEGTEIDLLSSGTQYFALYKNVHFITKAVYPVSFVVTPDGLTNVVVKVNGQEVTGSVSLEAGTYPVEVTADNCKAYTGNITITADAATHTQTVAMTYLPADYTKVDEAIAKANALNKDNYKDFSGVEAAVKAVVRDKNITEQSEVDAMAKAIEDAIAALEQKPSSGGDDNAPTYAIEVDKDIRNGEVTANRRYAERGDTVTITVTPDKGYTLETLTVTDKNGKEVKLTEKNGKYAFTMPASKVTVTATFMDDNTMLNFFVDVKASDYYYDAVLWAAQNGITSGTDAEHFSPNQPCTRAQIVTFLWRAAGSPEPKSMSSFSDVSADSYYAKAVAWAVENGITTGTGDGKFSPDATCTRAQSVTFLFRAIGKLVDSKAEFSDVLTDSYYANAVAWAVENGVTNGIGDGLFGPDNSCTRAQIVTFLFRAYQGK